MSAHPVRRAVDAMIGDDHRYSEQGRVAWDAMTPAEREQLGQLLFQGPVFDGCVISKADRTNLIEYGLAVRCCFKGKTGYTAATYAGCRVYKDGRGEIFKTKRGTEG